MSTKRSRVHPKYKTQYRVANWSDYDPSLVERGNITVWLTPDAITSWNAKPTKRRGGQRKYSDLAIETHSLFACFSIFHSVRLRASCCPSSS